MASYVYILANKKEGVLYIGVTSDLITRIYNHKLGILEGFTKRYKINKLVYYEIFDEIIDAISREKAIKKWRRQWKLDLIEKMNPEWNDLYESLF